MFSWRGSYRLAPATGRFLMSLLLDDGRNRPGSFLGNRVRSAADADRAAPITMTRGAPISMPAQAAASSIHAATP